MKKIILIGAGQLGSRHLQGLRKMSEDAKIYVVDPDEESLKVAEERANDIESDISVFFYRTIESISEEHFNLAIIATNANIRAKVTQDLINLKEIDYIIFEKILFQNVVDFKNIERLLRLNNITAWVNCPRRVQPLYKKMLKYLNSVNELKMKVYGGNWGLACNGIHFLDLFYFLTGSEILEINTENLDFKILESKREGFKEISGALTGENKQYKFEIISSMESNDLVTICLQNQFLTINILEAKGEVQIHTNENDEAYVEKIIFQSDLTGIIADEILATGTCGLTSYNESMNIHLDYIEKIRTHIEKSLQQKMKYCPIT